MSCLSMEISKAVSLMTLIISFSVLLFEFQSLKMPDNLFISNSLFYEKLVFMYLNFINYLIALVVL